MAVGEKTGIILKSGDHEEKGFMGIHWPASMFTYYSWARLFGYWAQTGQGPASEWIEKNIVKGKIDGKFSKQTQKYWGYIEAVAFTFVATLSFFAEKKNLKNNIYDAISAERETNPDEANLFSLYKSDNPFIRSLRDRFTMQQASRFPAALLFAKNVVAGVFAVTFNYTLERSIFIENNAYDVLQNTIYEVQKLKVSGNRDIDRLYTALERSLQRALKDNHRRPLSEAELLTNKEVFARLTSRIIDEKFHVKDAVYILGQIANHPDRADKLLAEIEKMEEIGLKGLARQKAKLASYKTSSNTPKVPEKRSFVQMSEKDAGTRAGVL